MKCLTVLGLLVLFLAPSMLHAQESREFVVAESPRTDVTMVDFLAEALAIPEVLIGVFEVPQRGDLSPTILRSGKILELIPDYGRVKTKYSLWKLNVVEGIRGDFDTVIFITDMPVLVEGKESRPFVPVPGSKWLLLLKSPYGQQGKLDLPSVSDVAELKAASFIHKGTFFQLYEGGENALCIKWPSVSRMRRPDYVKEVPEAFVSDVRVISDALKRTSSAAQKVPGSAPGRLNSSLGRAVAKKLFK